MATGRKKQASKALSNTGSPVTYSFKTDELALDSSKGETFSRFMVKGSITEGVSGTVVSATNGVTLGTYYSDRTLINYSPSTGAASVAVRRSSSVGEYSLIKVVITIEYSDNSHIVSKSVSGGVGSDTPGSITIVGGTTYWFKNDVVTIIATPSTSSSNIYQYRFINFTSSPNVNITMTDETHGTFVMPNEDITITAHFQPIIDSSTVSYYNGTSWIPCIVNYYDGTEFVECEPYYYNGTDWVPISTS